MPTFSVCERWLVIVAVLAFVIPLGGWYLDRIRLVSDCDRVQSRLFQTEEHLKSVQNVLGENGLKDPGGYYW
jgi:hypothetical protein